MRTSRTCIRQATIPSGRSGCGCCRTRSPAGSRAVRRPRRSCSAATRPGTSRASARLTGRRGSIPTRARPRRVGRRRCSRRAPRSRRPSEAASHSCARPGITRRPTARWASVSSTTSRSRRALQANGVERVAIVDFDVHHGNGTQDVFWDDDSVFFASLHQWPFYPGSGGPQEQRETTLNVPMSAGSGDEEYVHAFEHTVEPAVARFGPDVVLVSAGFDAHLEDPLAGMNVTADGFRELARRCAALAPRCAAVLEGGYNLETLPGLVSAALEGFTQNG